MADSLNKIKTIRESHESQRYQLELSIETTPVTLQKFKCVLKLA